MTSLRVIAACFIVIIAFISVTNCKLSNGNADENLLKRIVDKEDAKRMIIKRAGDRNENGNGNGNGGGNNNGNNNGNGNNQG
jgi:hypothetical protein